MTQHDDNLRFLHMLEYAQEATGLTKGKERADLESDRKLELALTRLLEVIGEAAHLVSEKAREKYPQIP
jgi:uncharacterized protein with HEPN domain